MASTLDRTDSHDLLLKFNDMPNLQYTFTQPTKRFPHAEVTMIAGEMEPKTLQHGPLTLTYDGAHSIYRGAMVQPSGYSSGRSLPPVDVALKWAAGKELIARLENEAKIYEDHLGTLQGSVVPRYYGFYTGVVRNITVACMVLEFCQSLPVDDVYELNRRRMLAATELHKAGVFHSRLLDTRHFISLGDGSLRIVDFSEAKVHECPGALPLCFGPLGDPRPAESCGELDVVESRYGVDAERHGRQLRWANGYYPEFVNSFFYQYS